jgi:YidC/Oxa1 family membrane protein insertase
VAAAFAELTPAPAVTLRAGPGAEYVIDPEAGGLTAATLSDFGLTLGNADLPALALQPEQGEWHFSHARVLAQDERRLSVERQIRGTNLVLEQHWSVPPESEYALAYRYVVRNTGSTPVTVDALRLRAGVMPDLGTPSGFMGAGGFDQRIDILPADKSSPKVYDITKVRKLDAEDRGELRQRATTWLAVQNKYFASIVSAAQPFAGVGMVVEPTLVVAFTADAQARPGLLTGTVSRKDRLEQAVTVTLASDREEVVVPPTVVLPSYASAATFEVTIPAAARANVTAQAPGYRRTTSVAQHGVRHDVATNHDLLEGVVFLPGKTLEAGEALSGEIEVFIGPKRFDLLEKLGENKKALMQFDLLLFMHFGWFESISRVILWGLTTFERMTGSYGLAILLITLVLRLLFWPVTHKSTVMSRKMQEIQPLAKELREKYSSDPQKLHQKTMELYREHKVNPLSGCLPALLQIPAFFALFNVLRSAIELRHAGFLWAQDLSLPDSVLMIPLIGLPLNPLAILMGASMVLQMKIVPTSADPTQQRMMMIMSGLFIVFLYTMPSGLTLYWTANQVLNIIQYRITHNWMDKQRREKLATA